jgi:hypothetical protein
MLDQYTTHTSKQSKELFKTLLIEVIYVPKGGTSLYQPLDRRVLGVMKQKAVSKWTNLEFHNQLPSSNNAFAVQLSIDCWKEINKSTILSAWDFESEGDSLTDDCEKDANYVQLLSEPSSVL